MIHSRALLNAAPLDAAALAEMTARKIRVLHLLRSLGIGGAERRVLRLGAGLDPERYDVHALSFYPVQGQSLAWPADRHHHFPMAPGFQWGRLLSLADLMRKGRFDIVHSHNWATMFYGVLAGRLARVPVVLHGEHGRNDLDRDHISWKRDLLAAGLARLATRVVAVNEAIAADVGPRWRLAPAHIVCLPNGVDLTRFHPPAVARTGDAEFVVGTVARFDGIKNLPCLISAFERFHGAAPAIRKRLVLVGSGPLWDQIRLQAARSPVADLVQFVGETDRPQDWYQRFDVFANTSFSEGMSNSILEAMACGVPIVASDIDGNRCWLQEGRHALFFQSDNAEALARQLQQLALDPALATRMGQDNAERVRTEYDNRRFLERYGALYQSLLSAAGR